MPATGTVLQRWRHGREFTGVDGDHATLGQTQIQKHGEQEDLKGISPREFWR